MKVKDMLAQIQVDVTEARDFVLHLDRQLRPPTLSENLAQLGPVITGNAPQRQPTLYQRVVNGINDLTKAIADARINARRDAETLERRLQDLMVQGNDRYAEWQAHDESMNEQLAELAEKIHTLELTLRPVMNTCVWLEGQLRDEDRGRDYPAGPLKAKLDRIEQQLAQPKLWRDGQPSPDPAFNQPMPPGTVNPTLSPREWRIREAQQCIWYLQNKGLLEENVNARSVAEEFVRHRTEG